MKKNIFSFKQAGMAAAALIATTSARAEAPQQPNIILFMVDDMGWQDTSEPFWTERTPYNDLCSTPNMERLSRQGVKFTQAYACAVSSPSRTSLMTGMNAARHRVTNWTLNLNTTTDASDATLAFPSWNFNGLQPAEASPMSNGLNATPLAAILKGNNYYTIHTGKAHWGSKSTLGAEPKNLGFDVNIAGSEIGGPASYYAQDNFGTGAFHIPGLENYYSQNIFLSEALTLETKKALDARPKEKPFYLYMSHYAVHVPIQIDSRFKNNPKYAGMSGSELAYLTMVEGMDKSLGDLMDWVETNNLTQNTVVIFMSDNGGHNSIGNITKNSISYAHNYPCRGAKGSVYEGGVREPMIVKWPGVTTSDTSTDKPVIIEDFFPTILEMAGVKNYQTVQTLDGVSFVPVLKNEVVPERDIYWHFPNKWGEVSDGCEAFSSIRSGDYKLIYRWGNSAFELYNIKNDIGEKTNLIATEKAKAIELSKKLADYLRSVNAQRPTIKSTNTLVVWPDEAKFPTLPVQPQISTINNQYWYKIQDNRSPQNFWQVDGTGKLALVKETIINDTTTANKLFKVKIAADNSSYQFYSMTNEATPFSAANTNGGTPLTNTSLNAINSWNLIPSTAAPNYYLFSSATGAKQLNSFVDQGMIVSFWTPAADTDPGNRWAFIPGFLKNAVTAYPAMSRFFTNATVPQEQAASRYLTLVKTKINNIEQTLLTATVPPFSTAGITTNTILPNAVMNALNPQILLPKNTSSFELTCLGSTDNARNLQYTQQNVFIDWNKDFDFLDANEAGVRNSTTTPNLALVTAPGFTRTISIPTGISAGTYRMRVIYHEPETAATEWSTTIWSSNTIRNGIAYDFELKIEDPSSLTLKKTNNPTIRVNQGYITVDGKSNFELYTISGQTCQPDKKQAPGVYIVKVRGTSTSVVLK